MAGQKRKANAKDNMNSNSTGSKMKRRCSDTMESPSQPLSKKSTEKHKRINNNVRNKRKGSLIPRRLIQEDKAGTSNLKTNEATISSLDRSSNELVQEGHQDPTRSMPKNGEARAEIAKLRRGKEGKWISMIQYLRIMMTTVKWKMME